MSSYGNNDMLTRLRVPLTVAGGVAAAAIVSYIALFVFLRGQEATLVKIDTVVMFVISLATCLIALGVAWFGVRITLLAHNYNPGSKLHIKILVLALLSAVCFATKAVWWMAVTSRDQTTGRPLWREVVSTLLSEIVPATCMCVIFWPIPRPPETFPLHRNRR